MTFVLAEALFVSLIFSMILEKPHLVGVPPGHTIVGISLVRAYWPWPMSWVMYFGPQGFFYAFWGFIAVMILTAGIYYITLTERRPLRKQNQMIYRTIATIVSSAIALYLWIYFSFIIFYHSGYVLSPTGSQFVENWGNTNIDYFIPLLIGIFIILTYAILALSYYKSRKASEIVAVVMSSFWGTFVLLFTYLLPGIPVFMESPQQYVLTNYSMFLSGEIAALVVALVLVFLRTSNSAPEDGV